MIAFDEDFIGYTERYVRSHSCGSDYASQLRKRAGSLSQFAGGKLLLGEVSADLVNRWLMHLAELGLSPYTVDGYRRCVRSVWLDAYEQGLCPEPPLGVRRIRKPALIVEAYTVDEIRLLLEAARVMPGVYPGPVTKSALWVAAILVGYDSGMRRGDVLTLRMPEIAGGRFAKVQNKTGFGHHGVFRQETVEAVTVLPHPRGLALPWPYAKQTFSDHFHDVRRLAGVDRGSFKWVRRAAGSYAEARRRGDGARLLGHRDSRCFDRHYRDRTITDEKPVDPPPL